MTVTVDAGDEVAAVQSLLLAGDDADKLVAAIKAASFLDGEPGDNRQKLRAARTKLRKLLAAKQQASDPASSSNTPRQVPSPHVKESYDITEFPPLASKYEKLNWRMISKPGGAVVRPEDFYKLYAYHMQATEGDNTTERPVWAERGGLDFEGRSKWDAWAAVKGMEADAAKLEFVKLYYEFTPQVLYKDTRASS